MQDMMDALQRSIVILDVETAMNRAQWNPKPLARSTSSSNRHLDVAEDDLATGVAGPGFGRLGNGVGQDRFMVESGITF